VALDLEILTVELVALEGLENLLVQLQVVIQLLL
tara:strand:+ start:153 stop:254 length:102 start_codon:yes stop_codon:yes gene_type:complete